MGWYQKLSAWIKNYGDDPYLQCTYTCIRVLARRPAHASKKDKVRRHWPRRGQNTPPIQCRLRQWRRTVPCNSRGFDGFDVLVITSLSMNIDLLEQLTTRIARLRLKRCGSIPAFTIFVVYAPTSNYNEEEVEAFYMDLEKLYREDHTFFTVTIGNFNAKLGPRRSSGERHIGTHRLEWNEQGERQPEFIIATDTIHGNSQFEKPHSQRWTWKSPNREYHNEIDHIISNSRFCSTKWQESI
uniref:Endonuclease/exonuclease/phosphatase domain-containing protein n=1 Tax=Angiostrongylus cantonensis TaxID=6313 RepID=A0A0K0DIH2_ANGCA